MAELTINEQVYRTGRMTAKVQFHVVRRLLPLVSSIGELSSEADTGNVLKVLAEAVYKLSDDDCDYILERCLSVCHRKQGDNWVLVWNQQAKQPQFSDIDMPAMLQLTIATLQENLTSFFPNPGGNFQLGSLPLNAPLN